jgi:hypothetical protein
MDLKNIQWGEFEIGEEFFVKNSKAYHKTDLKETKNNGISYISRTNLNNGLESIVKNDNFKLNKKNTIVFGAENATFFYQPNEYITGNKMYYIESDKLNKHSGLFIQMMLNKSIVNCGFGYGKGLIGSRVQKRFVKLPINSKGEPDYVFMEQFMRQKEQEKLENFQNYISKRIKHVQDFKEVEPLKQKKWGEFEIGNLFKIIPGKSKGLNHLKQNQLGVNYLGATNTNNGVLAYVKLEGNEKMLQKGNCIAFIRNGEGSMGFSIYKAEDFIASSDISVGYSKNLNKEIGLFITTIADKIRGKYNFGYKRSDTRLKNEKILLPTDKNGQPDYDYMENYIKKLEYEKLTKYLSIKNISL